MADSTVAIGGRVSDRGKAVYPVKASTKIPKGTLVGITSGLALYLGDVSGMIFAGVAVETADNSSGSNSDISVECWTDGQFLFSIASAAATDCGKKVYVSDNQTVTFSAATNVKEIGRMVKFISSTKIVVQIDFHNDAST